ncbi:MAG: efflux RND transporter periplasmic adaptor subunit [Alphaproteobacteria bacterium]|nr:efflux RND transporter periplasmic adaptor subunit [Alphaproteobacteria bacterium]
MLRALIVLSLVIASPVMAQDDGSHLVSVSEISDRKAVFATVESIDTVSARARIAGTIGELRVDEGDAVEAGDVLAVVINDQLAPQIGSANAGATALAAQLAQAQVNLERAQDLFERGIFPQARLDEAQTEVDVLINQLASARRARDVLVQQAREGDVLAPTSGRVLSVEVTAGSVVLGGEPVASIASDLYLLRLRLPERHARSISVGDPIAVDAATMGTEIASQGQIRQIYPRIADGRVVADAVVEGLGSFFVGERVRVYVAVDTRSAIIIPPDLIFTRFGTDYVRLQMEDGIRDVVVLRGEVLETGVEILSGIAAGDRLVQP